ncbi:DUF5700 domain-containing putative Zn-dependent protease [Chryseobacterium sp. JJR-5R]|uniref:DUF5700 domain-containing putative Zn-dependent protease n=1 Tax=Chryseobacterium sp. JJR-5R TaxID=3093923 RepID=UPI002A756F9E|nr:DUF5700 domain-containing putative Zn-dependent protease [Chryseobacterium sp. JJR-5R]WPO83572.1 DUF5700 domain-containing putative Zn-dependent protease [Chryseobacterium sp. JJR-5R]
MKKHVYCTFIILFFAGFLNLSKAQTFHMEALDAYWNMIEPLKKGDSLSQETWQKFLNLEPNQTYIQNQGFDKDYLERLRKSIEVVYMPKNADVLQKRVAAIEKDPASYWLTYKVYVYKQHEKELKEFQGKLDTKEYFADCYRNTFSMLPKNLQVKDEKISIYPIGIENDAIAGSGTVIATLWNLYNADKIQKGGLLGHEIHHVLRKGFDFKNVEKKDEGLMYFLQVILNEGSADLIEKPTNIASEKVLPYALCYKDFLIPQADSIVSVVNRNIIDLKTSGGKNFKTEKDYRNLVQWTSGHKPGYYMADIIVKNGLKKQLLQNIQNPFQFIYLYNKAAKKDPGKPSVFSDEAMSYIKMIEKKYWPSRFN